MSSAAPVVAIIDYELGNIFSVSQACAHVGLTPVTTANRADIRAADAVILPGVGAFGDAMNALGRLGLIEELSAFASSGRPLMGVCLGMQLLMTQSAEFGAQDGLNLIPGGVVGLNDVLPEPKPKVPHVGWNQLYRSPRPTGDDAWLGSPLEGLPEGFYMHFVHSFVVVPECVEDVIALTHYGGASFCSAVRRGNVFGCQGHPERSGHIGLAAYRNFAAALQAAQQEIG